ncbi:hypothetical protein FH972_025150 [Carpinus fangiana]|uniref:Anaphase-promoting complex subunit 4 WD40 domain-containing protein n=1 Tax=Carpinus fangiana TaxID=176857 RepID=A0A5N6L0Q9_9ROSI|nr:hypothetical protein FH972_025150 [Carpinus fangiana]
MRRREHESLTAGPVCPSTRSPRYTCRKLECVFSLGHPSIARLLTIKLGSGHAACIRFNRSGDLLASGRLDGTIVIFDIETNGVARKLRGHTRQDWKCVLWDLQDGSRLRTIRFTAPVFIAELHPNTHLKFVAALFDDQPILVDATEELVVKRNFQSAPKRSQLDMDEATEKILAQDAKQTTTVTTFSPSGDYIIAGTNKGWLNIIETASCQTMFSTHMAGGVITLLRFAPGGRQIVVNSSDRIIRTVHFPDLTGKNVDFGNFRLENDHKYQDIVNRLLWNHVAFSATAEYLVASIHMNHHVYVWETAHNSLNTILEGPTEELSAVEWHPYKPFLAAVGIDSGEVHLWSVIAPQKWSALAPDFAEVEENEEYIEREDEFDVVASEELTKRILRQEDEDIDVLTIDPVKGYGDHQEGGFKMPVLLHQDDEDSEDEIEAIGAGQYRRKSPGRGRDRNTANEATHQNGRR